MKPKQLPAHRWIILLCLLAVLIVPTTAWAHGPSDGGASTNKINDLFTIIFFISIPVFLLVEGLIIYAIYTSVQRRKDQEVEQIEGDHRLELFWTIMSFVIVGVLFALTYRFMTTQYEAEAQNETGTPDYTIQVDARMFDWDYYYFEGEDLPTNVTTTTRLYLPTDRLILLEINSLDVQHSFWVPDLAGKVDAVPGYTNTMWLTIDEPGIYTGNCAEFCGEDHAKMIIEIEAMEPTDFIMWLAEAKGKAGEMIPMGTDMDSDLPPGNSARGEALYNGEVIDKVNCVSCHASGPGVGPSLPQIREDMHEHEGYTAEYYLRESILLPCEYEVEGYSCAIMNSVKYGEALDEQALADIIAYLMNDED